LVFERGRKYRPKKKRVAQTREEYNIHLPHPHPALYWLCVGGCRGLEKLDNMDEIRKVGLKPLFERELGPPQYSSFCMKRCIQMYIIIYIYNI